MNLELVLVVIIGIIILSILIVGIFALSTKNQSLIDKTTQSQPVATDNKLDERYAEDLKRMMPEIEQASEINFITWLSANRPYSSKGFVWEIGFLEWNYDFLRELWALKYGLRVYTTRQKKSRSAWYLYSY
jgi:hypothetical protein